MKCEYSNQLDVPEVLRMIRTSSLISQVPAPVNFDLDLQHLTKLSNCKLQPVSISYCQSSFCHESRAQHCIDLVKQGAMEQS
jgi:hypothetical protein